MDMIKLSDFIQERFADYFSKSDNSKIIDEISSYNKTIKNLKLFIDNAKDNLDVFLKPKECHDFLT